MFKESESTFFLQRPKNCHLYEKVLNLSKQQRNVNQQHYKISGHTCQENYNKDNRSVSLGTQRKACAFIHDANEDLQNQHGKHQNIFFSSEPWLDHKAQQFFYSTYIQGESSLDLTVMSVVMSLIPYFQQMRCSNFFVSSPICQSGSSKLQSHVDNEV